MGSKCCCHRGSVQDSVMTLANLKVEATELKEMAMEEANDDAGPSEQEAPSPTLKESEIVERFGSVSLGSQEETSGVGDGLPFYRASNILWSSGSFSDAIPNGFYSVIPDNRLKLYKSIPTMDELRELCDEGLKLDVILVDFKEDKKLDRLIQLIDVLVKGLNSNPVAVIKKIARLVADIYKRPTRQSPAKATQSFGIDGIQLLGQIKRGSCRARAILFKVLADTVGLESRLVVGFPSEPRSSTSVESYNHMSIVVVINTEEMLVDLRRSPGQLTLLSTKAIYMAHISAAGNDSCDSPLKPNSPPSVLHSGLSVSRSEPNIATEFLLRNQRKVNTGQRSSSSSPKHISVRAHARSMLGGDRTPTQEFSDDVSSCESDESAELEIRRTRRSLRSTPEFSKEVRVVSESLQQSCLVKEQSDDGSSRHSEDDGTGSPDLQKTVTGFRIDAHQNSGEMPLAVTLLPSERNLALYQTISHVLYQVRASPSFRNKLLLPHEKWNIHFSELRVGTLVATGSCAEVFRGNYDGKNVAIKMFLMENFTNENIQDFCNEISMLSCLRHPNVIEFYGACIMPPQLSLVTEFVERGSLYYMLHSSRERDNLNWQRKLKMLQDICRGLISVHQRGIVHRNLKSANCLLSNEWTVKICGFGLSRRNLGGRPVRDAASEGSPEWMAPELLRNEPVSEKCDIFSFGVIMWELSTLSKPWEGVPKETVIPTVANEGALLEIPQGPLSNLIADCWSEVPMRRPSGQEILACLITYEKLIC